MPQTFDVSGQRPLPHTPGNAICYSGYRDGQSPANLGFPTPGQIREDLRLLQPNFRHLRLYDCSQHALRVLQVIQQDSLPFEVMLGAYLGAEVNNPGCPWGGTHSDAALQASIQANADELLLLVDLAGRYPHIVTSVAVGNEATVDWTDHLVPVPRMVDHVRWVRQRVAQPVTFCENYVPWQGQLDALVPELDFLSIHTYPVWEYQAMDTALAYTQANLASVARCHPGKPLVITEAGWTTASNGRGIEPHNASVDLQSAYCQALHTWAAQAGVRVYFFEAFDEAWKGSDHPLEPEKHWGLYTADRMPKPVVQALFGR